MKKTNKDLIVGASMLVALFILVTSVLWLKEVSVTQKTVEYSVLFDNIGTLQQGDPVMVNGVRKGVAAKIGLRGEEVEVRIKLDKSITLTDSSTITVQNIGIMGERMIGIQLSSKGTPYPPNDPKHDKITYIKGNFDSGIAEAMGMLGIVLRDVLDLVENVEEIVASTVGDSSFLDMFESLVGRLDTISLVATDLLAGNRNKINAMVTDLRALSSDARELVSSNRESIETIVTNGADLTGEAGDVLNGVDTIMVSLNTILSRIERGEGAVGMLLEDEKIYHDLKATLAGVDTLVREVQADGLKLRVKLGFRKRSRE